MALKMAESVTLVIDLNLEKITLTLEPQDVY